MKKGILYNTSFFVNGSVEEKFCEFIQKSWISLLKEDQRVDMHYFSKIHVAREDELVNYSLLIKVDLADIESYRKTVEANLISVIRESFGESVMNMSTIMEII